MKTFKILKEELTLILEAKIDDIKQKYKNINIKHDPYINLYDVPMVHSSDKKEINGNDKDLLIDHIHNAIPDKNISHLSWAIDKYHAGEYKHEDLPQLTNSLQIYNKYKKEIGKSNINQFKSLSDLNFAVVPYREKEESLDQEKQNIINSGSTLVHNKGDVKVYKLHGAESNNENDENKKRGREACKLLGSSTWCISQKDNTNKFGNVSLGYNKPTYIVHLENEEHPYRKIGIIHGTGEFQDENNKRIEDEELESLVNRNPEFKNVNDFQGHRWEITKNKNDYINNHFNKFHKFEAKRYMNHPELDDEHKNKLFKLNKDIETVLTSTNNDELDKYKYNPNRAIRFYITNKRVVGQNTLHDMRNDEDENIRINIAKRKDLRPDTLKDLSNDENSDVRYFVAGNNNTHPDILHKLSSDKEGFIRASVSNNNNTRPDTLDKLSNDNDSSVREKIAENKNTHQDTLDKLSNDKDEIVRASVSNNNNTRPDTLDKLSNDKDEIVRWYVASNKNTHPDTLHKMRNDKDYDVKLKIVNHEKVHDNTLEHIRRHDKSDFIRDIAQDKLDQRNNMFY